MSPNKRKVAIPRRKFQARLCSRT